MTKILATVASVTAGGAVAIATVLGVVSSQTGTAGETPANVNQSVVDYGATESE